MMSPNDAPPPNAPLAPAAAPLPPLSPAMQHRIRTLLQEIRRALQHHQLSPEVEAEIANLVSGLEPELVPNLVPQLLTEAIAHDTLSPQIQEQLRMLVLKHTQQQRSAILVERVRDALQNEALSDKIQVELSQLLSLLPHARLRPDLMDELDLAISALINPIPAAQPRNLRFSRHLRQQLAVQLQQNPNPLWSIASASGSSHNRLVAGLSWFLVVFALIPSGVSAIFFASGVTRQYHEIQTLEQDLAASRDQLAANANQLANLSNHLNGARQSLVDLQATSFGGDPPPENSLPARLQSQQQQQQELQTAVGETRRQLNTLLADLETMQNSPALGTPTAADSEAARASLQNQLTEAIAQLREIRQSPLLAGTGEAPPAVDRLQQTTTLMQGDVQALDASLTKITGGLTEAIANPTPASPAPTESPTPTPTPTIARSPQPDDGGDSAVDTALLSLLNVLLQNINNVNMPLMLAVVATGALGSFVSVIVRANEFIDKEQKAGLDLFLVGFFRPIVGMAFAFFLVAVLESGILSGFLSINSVKPDKKIYLYVAIAFVAGFSERLVKDIVGQTASMVGPKNNQP